MNYKIIKRGFDSEEHRELLQISNLENLPSNPDICSSRSSNISTDCRLF